MPTNNEIKKDTVYIDVDEEITSIIEKLQNSEQKIVALVLPKRATVLQSVVNMKLLKRSAESAKKHVVLITSEQGLLPLAGAVGMHVASSLQSRPSVPPAPGGSTDDRAYDEDTGEAIDDFDLDAQADRPIGSLAGYDDELVAGSAVGAAAGTAAEETASVSDRLRGGAAATAASPKLAAAGSRNRFSEPETIELDNADPTPVLGAAAAATASKADTKVKDAKPPKGKDKSLKIPNFHKFRLALILGIVLIVLLGGGFIYANIALAKATITLKTDSSDIATKASLTFDPSATELDTASDTLPAKIASKQQTGSQQVSTTGQKNNGEKATGTVSVTVTCSKKPAPIDSGTGFSSGALTYISSGSIELTPSGFDLDGNVTCKGNGSVVAQQAGAKYNLDAGSSFKVAGYSNASAQNGTAFSGGTDQIVKIIAQADIDSAKSKISSSSTSGIKSDLVNSLQSSGYKALEASLQAGTPTVTPSAAVGDQADTVTVSQVTPYTMYGFKAADIKKVITASVNKQIDTTKQQILKDGYDQAKYTVSNPASSGTLTVGFSTTSLAGPDIQADKLTTELAGKKTGDVQSAIKSLPGVTGVDVKYSPFWINSVPKNTKKITILVQKSDSTTTNVTSGTTTNDD